MKKPLHQFKHIYNPYNSDYNMEQPSLHEEANINASVKPIDRSKADIEAEKDEVILKPDLSGIYKILGKRHSQGGTPIKAEEGSFIYSDYKKLALSKEEQELLKLKTGGSFAAQKNTPSEVLRRNIDLKHYNKLVHNLQDIKKDIIAKRSSELMLGKYIDILGRIAYAQESKKNFEDGIPPFAENTAPVTDPTLQYNIDKQEQYKKGGMVNPYLEKAQRGRFNTFRFLPNTTPSTTTVVQNTTPATKIVNPNFVNNNAANSTLPPWLKPWIKSNTVAGRISPTKKITTYDQTDGNKIYDNYSKWKVLNNNKDFNSAKELQSFIYDYVSKRDPNVLSAMWEEWGETARASEYPQDYKEWFTDDFLGARTLQLMDWINKKPEQTQGFVGPIEQHFDFKEEPTSKMEDKTFLPYEPNVKKTLPMHIDEMWSGVDAAGVKKYNPYRQQIKSQLVDFARYNSQAGINRVNEAVNSAYNATRGLNPYQSQSTINEIFGKAVEDKAKVQSQYDEQNMGVENTQNQSIQQIQNKDLIDNSNFDKRYYDEQTLSNQRFDNAKTAAWNSFRSLRNLNQETLDSLYNVLAQQPIAGSKPVLDKNGRQKYDANGKPIYQSMPLYDVVPGTIRTRYTGVGNILNTPGTSGGTEQANNILSKILELNESPSSNPQVEFNNSRRMASLVELYKLMMKPSKRLGGVYNPYKLK